MEVTSEATDGASMKTWSEDNSETYRKLASVVVPHRAEQMAALLTLLPFNKQDSFRTVELASGEGKLAHAILSAFPNSTLLALDGSESMRQATGQKLAPFGERVQVKSFDLTAHDWYGLLNAADAVVSSLSIHHLDGADKQALYKAIHGSMGANGALLIADLVMPARAQARELFAATWDRSVQTQANDPALYDDYLRTQWNYFRFPDEHDQPSPLYDQLTWLNEAGFFDADCFWMQAGHAIFGGYKGSHAFGGGIDYDQALQAVYKGLSDK